VSSEAESPEPHRTHTPSPPEEIRRKMLFGVALILSLASVYAGLLQLGRAVQWSLGGLALLAVLAGLVTGATGPPQPPAPEPPATPEPPPQ
jgi:hypothetical protein